MRIIAVTGASGGHIFPALAFLEALRCSQPGVRTLLVLPEGGFSGSLDTRGQPFRYIPISGMTARMRRNPAAAAWQACIGCARSIEIIVRFKPDLVVGFGSLASVPVVLCAWLFRVPTMIHEQNVIPGRANLFLSRFVDRVAVSFEESRALFPHPDRAVLTGNPLRSRMRPMAKDEARRAMGLLPDVFTVLVTGGSQGSSSINRACMQAFADPALKGRIQVIHITGKGAGDAAAKAYSSCGITSRVVPFLEEMETAYSASDIAICRGGATTCAELAFFALPALIVPYPYAQAHQSRNAAALESKGLCRVVSDSELDGGKVKDFVNSCLDEPGFLAAMKAAFKTPGREEARARLAAAAMGVER
ncbi:MAG: UDP-N-acetylglucosamine--N-acetylmuramyl-(pentapeptide) pyrophosphoryl-undecaprenol N-acetylglucosamine transferase [Deltaproteobacteria bacterium]